MFYGLNWHTTNLDPKWNLFESNTELEKVQYVFRFKIAVLLL